MNKRMRKKCRVGEYRELGFELHVVLRSEASAADYDRFVDQLVDEVERAGLACGGGGVVPNFTGFVTRAKRGSVTEEQRGAFADAVQKVPKVLEPKVGPLVDAWHPARTR